MRVPDVDPHRSPRWWKRVLLRAAMSQPGRWFGINVASRIDPWLMRVSGGTLSVTMGAFPVVLMTARGRRSGREHTTPLVYFTERDDVVLMASSFGRARHPAWYHNLRANPEVTLTTSGRSGRYRAQEATGDERDRLYAKARALYEGYGGYEQAAAATRPCR